MRTRSAAVIGAGVAGLAAAGELARRGHRVSVFDKGRGPGGRISTRRAAPWSFDHGAQYFTARDPRFVEAVRDWLAEGVVARWEGRIVALESTRVCELRESTERFVGAPAMSALATRLAHGLDVQCGVEVASVEPTVKGWRLASRDGAPLGEFDALVAALPIPQAATLLGAEFPFAQRAAAIAVEPCWAALVGFDEPLALEFDGAFCDGPELSWIARNNSKPGRPAAEAWVLHARAEWTRANLERDRNEIAEALRAAFERAVGASLPRPVHADAHRWRYALPSPLDAAAELAWSDASKQLVLAGDGCVGGRVEGAWLSGVAAANAVLAWLSSPA